MSEKPKTIKVVSKSILFEKKDYDGKKMIAMVLIRGMVRAKQEIKDTLKMLNLHRKNYCAIIRNTKSNMGMINKVKDYITFGDVSEDTVKTLIEKRGERNPKDPKKTKRFFRLSPPIGGFERKGIKMTFATGGALGYRGEHINNLIKKMI